MKHNKEQHNTHVLILILNNGYKDVRVRKEAEVLAKQNYTVTVIGITEEIEEAGDRIINNVRYINLHNYNYTELSDVCNIILSSIIVKEIFFIKLGVSIVKKLSLSKLFPEKAKQYLSSILQKFFADEIFEYRVLTVKVSDIDVVHAHEIHALVAGYTITNKFDIPFIYEAHEYYTDYLKVNFFDIKHRLINKWIQTKEKLYLKKSDAVISVSEGISEILADKYSINKIISIYNSPPYKEIKIDIDIRKNLHIDANEKIVLYVGNFRFNDAQGNKIMFRALRELRTTHFVILGPKSIQDQESAINYAKLLGVEKRVHFLDPVPVELVSSYIRTADASIIFFPADVINHIYCLPNKVFHSVLGKIPILYTKGLKEIDKICVKYTCGLSIDTSSVENISEGLSYIYYNKDIYTIDEKNKNKFIKEYGWARQEEKLLSLYRNVLNK